MKITSILKIFAILALSTSVSLLVSCGKDEDPKPWWEIEEEEKPGDNTDPENPENPDNPDNPDNQDNPTVSEKPRFMWIDAAANFPTFANSRENIARDLKRAYDSGITDVVVDVRPSMGDVLFNTSVVDQIKKLDYWSNTGYKYYERTATWDYLQAFIDEGHALGLRVHAAMNTFAGGCRYLYGLGEQGLVFRDSSKKSWVTTILYNGKLVNEMDCSDDAYATKFFNPANDEVQEFLLALIRDLAKYNVDGIFLDRCRYDDYSSDFSDITKQKFEQYIGTTVSGFPDAVYTSAYEKKWIAFRAQVIHDFIVKARQAVKSVNNNIQFGVYVGAWYSEYYTYGVNWASPRYNAASHYSWASQDWNKAGYADQLDFLLLGAYAGVSSIYGSNEWSCQGFCQLAREKLAGDVKFAGGPDVGNGTGWENGGQANAVTQTIDACINASDGYFIFDMVHVRQYNYWNAILTGVIKYKASLK